MRWPALIPLLLLLAACTHGPIPDPDKSAAEAAARFAQAEREEAQIVGDHNEASWRHDLPLIKPDLVARAAAHEKFLLDQPDYTPAPRFTQTLALSDESTLELSRPQLLAQLQQQLNQLKHVHREPSSPGGPDDSPETLAASEKLLSRCDLLNLRLLLAWLAQPATAAQILALGNADRADTSSEHGGTLAPDAAGTLQLETQRPLFSGSDLAYFTSDYTLSRVPFSLALFHLHFHQSDNAENAGPGIGDLRFARINRTTCLVLTCLSPTSFDADYYNPEGAIVDLGVYGH